MLWKNFLLQFSHQIVLDESFIAEDNFLSFNMQFNFMCLLITCDFNIRIVSTLFMPAVPPPSPYWASVPLLSCTVVATKNQVIFLCLEMQTVCHLRTVLCTDTVQLCVPAQSKESDGAFVA